MKDISIASGWTYAVRKKRSAPEFEMRRLETYRRAGRVDWSGSIEDGTPWEFVTRTNSVGQVRVLSVRPGGGLRPAPEFDGVELASERGTLVVKRRFTDSRPPLFGPGS